MCFLFLQISFEMAKGTITDPICRHGVLCYAVN
jgi:hypothetical protein